MRPARIPPVDPANLDAAQQRVFDAVAARRGKVAGPFAVLLHSPELADRIQALGQFIRYDSSLGPRRSELAILATARAWSCQFEWYAHEPLARTAGVPAGVIEAVRVGRRPDGGDAIDGLIFDLVTDLIKTGQVPDATYDYVVDALGLVSMVELTALVGYYTLLAMTLNAHRIGTPDGSTPLEER